MKFVFILSSLIISFSALGGGQLSEQDLQCISVKLCLATMHARDQIVRAEISRLAEQFGFAGIAKLFDYKRAIDIENTEQLKALIADYGWPGIKRYGVVADNDAWLVVQHADHDVAFQEQVLSILEKEMQYHNTSPEHYAYLYDRVKVNKSQPQKYGTQGTCVGHRKWQAHPIAGEKWIDLRRHQMHLSPMHEYVKRVSKLCP